MKYQWFIEPTRPVLAADLAHEHRVSPLVAQCLVNRGIATVETGAAYLEPRLKSLSDPFEVPGMSAAIERLLAARERGEPLLIFGDYDVDGVTSTVVLLETLTALGWKAHHYLPHRQEDGYGLSRECMLKCLAESPVKLILAVDCGSSATDCITWLREQGVDVLVLDHHQISDPPPPACAMVNPRIAHSFEHSHRHDLPFFELCSVGLAFKLAHALTKRGRELGMPAAQCFDVRSLLDLVALGTIADVVPLVRENRVLVSAGLERLCTNTRPGIVALKTISGSPARVDVHEVAFQLAPRLNAAGRLESAEDALKLLRSQTVPEAMVLAQKLNEQNSQRKAIERQMAEQVLARVQSGFVPGDTWAIVEGDSSWHIGVAGVVASRVQHQFYRPTIILGSEGQYWRGSGRSVAGFDLAAALRQCGDLLVRHGGHSMAAGLTMDPSQLATLRARLNEAVRAAMGTTNLLPPLRIDAEVGLNEITFDFLTVMNKLRPFGLGNPVPQFCARNLHHARPLQRMGAEKQHVKMWLTDGTATHEAVWWSAGAGHLPVGRFDLAFVPEINNYQGRTTVQLKVLDWRPADSSGNQTKEMRF